VSQSLVPWSETPLLVAFEITDAFDANSRADRQAASAQESTQLRPVNIIGQQCLGLHPADLVGCSWLPLRCNKEHQHARHFSVRFSPYCTLQIVRQVNFRRVRKQIEDSLFLAKPTFAPHLREICTSFGCSSVDSCWLCGMVDVGCALASAPDHSSSPGFQ
jgi:hypothetical protein